MDYEDFSVKEILIANKIKDFTDKIIEIVVEERNVFAKVVDYPGQINLMCITAVLNALTSILASDIHDGVFHKDIISSLIEDFKSEIDRKLDIFQQA